MRTEKHIVSQFEHLRAAAGWSPAEMARQLGITTTEYRRVQDGRRSPRAIELWRASLVFRRPMAAFIDDDVSLPPAQIRAGVGDDELTAVNDGPVVPADEPTDEWPVATAQV